MQEISITGHATADGGFELEDRVMVVAMTTVSHVGETASATKGRFETASLKLQGLLPLTGTEAKTWEKRLLKEVDQLDDKRLRDAMADEAG